MKIVLAHYKYYIQGGPERYMFNFIELARINGCEVIPFSINYPTNVKTEYSKYFVSAATEVSELSTEHIGLVPAIKRIKNEMKNSEAYHKLKNLIKNEKPDLLYCLIPGNLSPEIFRAAKEEGLPVIIRLSDFRLICGCNTLLRDSNICELCINGNNRCLTMYKCVKDSRLLSSIRRMTMEYIRNRNKYKYVDAVITPSKHTCRIMVKSGFFPYSKMHVNPTFIDCAHVSSKNVSKDYVLCLGRFSPEKGFVYVIEAMRYLKDIPVRVAVTGDKESCDKSIRDVIEDYDLENKVDFIGFVNGETLVKITSEALCVAAPAIWYENLPNVVLEAYSYGKPVIASNLGSLSEVIEDGRTGLLFEPKNVAEIARCIRKLYENPDYCSELGRNARKKCETDYSPVEHWNSFLDICNEVL